MQNCMEVTGIVQEAVRAASPTGEALVEMRVKSVQPYSDIYGNKIKQDQVFTILSPETNYPQCEEEKRISLIVHFKNRMWITEKGMLRHRTILTSIP